METTLELKNMWFHAYHGVLEHERAYGNDFCVTLRIEADLSLACDSDKVDDTINYAVVYNLVREEIMKPSNLIENAAYRILRRVKSSFPQISRIEVAVSKRNPPVGGPVEWSSVTISE